MKIKLDCGSITEYKCDLMVVNLFEGVKHPSGATGAMDKALEGAISNSIKSGEITGKIKEAVVLHTCGKIPADKVLCVGLGKNKEFDLEKIRRASASAVKAAKKTKAKKVATIIHGGGIGGIDPADSAAAIIQGSILADYEYTKHKTKKDNDKAEISEFVIIDYDPEKIEKVKAVASDEQIIVDGVNKVRDLVNGPSNEVTPGYLADRAKEIARQNKLEIEVLGRKEIESKGMKALAAVAKGSKEEPKVIVLKYNGGGKEKYGLVGKGITFDSGGISLKPTKGMWEMKSDMAGAAAVLETMGVIAQLKQKVNIIAVIPATENMPGGEAYKPGDVIGSLAGKTSEIISTDAEGRLVMIDALTYAKELGATKLIDIATLTGACTVALGDVAAAILGTDEDLIKKSLSLVDKTGEKLWRLPIFEEYKEYLKSDIADLKNSTDRGGKAGTSTGATYLKEFIDGTPWIHFDIAGTAYLDRKVGHMDKGATGFGVRTLAYLFAELSK